MQGLPCRKKKLFQNERRKKRKANNKAINWPNANIAQYPNNLHDGLCTFLHVSARMQLTHHAAAKQQPVKKKKKKLHHLLHYTAAQFLFFSNARASRQYASPSKIASVWCCCVRGSGRVHLVCKHCIVTSGWLCVPLPKKRCHNCVSDLQLVN